MLRVREWTPSGRGAVSVLRILGNGALERVRALSLAAAIPIGRPSRLLLRADEEDLDEAIVCAFSPEEVELHLHGSPFLVRRVIACLGGEPATTAENGTIEDLAHDFLSAAPCEAAARILLDQAEGALSRELRALVALGESQRGPAIDTLLARWRIARWALRPAKIVIAGRANAGKSTLFNALLGERRAIVDAEPGTTRDLNRARARLGPWPVILVDTAGDREISAAREGLPSQASIEVRGQELARSARADADLVLWLDPIEPGRSVPPPEPSLVGDRLILVRTFADRAALRALPAVAVSALAEPNSAHEVVAAAFRDRLGLPEDPWTPRAGVPFTEGLALEIESLRRAESLSLAPAIEALLRRPRALPRPGCGEASDPIACPTGSA